MKKTTFFPLILLLVVAAIFACGNDDRAPQPRLRWQLNPFGNTQIESIYPIFFKKTVIISQNLDSGSSRLAALSLKNGAVLWQTDLPQPLYYNLKSYIFGKNLVLPAGETTLAIDLETGGKIWQKTLGAAAEQALEGHEKHIFQTFYPSENEALVFSIDILTADTQVVHHEICLPGHKIFLRTPTPIFQKGKNAQLLFCKTEYEIASRQSVCTLQFFDLETRKIIQTDTLAATNTDGLAITKQPIFDEKSGKIFLVLHEKLICYDLASRQPIWQSKQPRDMLTSQPILDEHGIFFPAEDGFLYKIDQKTGQTIWKTLVSGTPSRPSLAGNFLHIVGGGGGKWRVIRTSDGQTVGEIASPNQAKFEGIFWRRYFSVLPDGKFALATDGKDFCLFEI